MHFTVMKENKRNKIKTTTKTTTQTNQTTKTHTPQEKTFMTLTYPHPDDIDFYS